ncbi:MAG: hypothetical protein JO011_00810 [Ktedonobacteraceae bacterium]|nr:hypothetical protein [Ktedonobacteraceae bacterium]
MSTLTLYGACAVTIMLIAYALESRSVWWVLVFAFACAASSLYGWLAGTWPFGIIEGIWALIAIRRWWQRRKALVATTQGAGYAQVTETGVGKTIT